MINKKNGNLSNTKQYSQVVKTMSTNDIINVNHLNQTIENLTTRIENMETNIINKVSEKFNEYKIEQEEFIIKKIDEFSKFQDVEVKKNLKNLVIILMRDLKNVLVQLMISKQDKVMY